MTKRAILSACCIALATQFAAATSEGPLRPPTGELAVPASEIILGGRLSYFSRLAANEESTISFVRVWLTELQLTFPDTVEFLERNQNPDGFTFFDSRVDDYGRLVVASKFENHRPFLNSGLYRMPLVLLGMVNDETATEIKKQLLEHFKRGAEQVKRLKDPEIQAEFTVLGMLEHLVQPSVYGVAIDGFDERTYIRRSLELILEAGRQGHLSRRVVGYLTYEILHMMGLLYHQKAGQLHLIYSNQTIASLIRQIANLPGANADFVVAAEQSLLGLSCDMLLQATPSRH